MEKIAGYGNKQRWLYFRKNGIYLGIHFSGSVNNLHLVRSQHVYKISLPYPEVFMINKISFVKFSAAENDETT